MAFDTIVGLTAKDKQGKSWNVKLNEADKRKLAQIANLSKVHTGLSRNGDSAIRSPWISPKDLTDPELRAKYEKRGLSMVALSHLILDLKPGGKRVRYLDGNTLNLVRANMNAFGSDETPRRQRKPKDEPKPTGRKPNGHTNGHAKMELVCEQRDVWVVRIGKHEDVFTDRQIAINHFATAMTERVR